MVRMVGMVALTGATAMVVATNGNGGGNGNGGNNGGNNASRSGNPRLY